MIIFLKIMKKQKIERNTENFTKKKNAKKLEKIEN